MKLEQKNVFITGSSRGIGLAIAHKFASLGANVVLNSRGEISEELLDEFKPYGVKVLAISGDVSDFTDAKRMVDQAIEEGKIDSKEGLKKVKTAEVGNIFNFGTQKTDEMGLYFTDKDGERKSAWMGSYGIGITRVMGVIAEKFSDEKGLIWPEGIAPAKIYLVQIGEKSKELAEEIYNELSKKGIEVLFDDRNLRPGQKFADAELMGIPYRLTVSDRLLESGEFEIVERSTGEVQMLSKEELFEKFSK